MRDVYEADSLHQAQLLVDRLREVGIKTVIRNEFLQGALGELPLTARPVVTIVNDADFARASDETRQFEAAYQGPTGPDQHCAHCGEQSPGNFQVCWRCRKPFDAEA